MNDQPRRPALRYFGGKFRLAPWLNTFHPPHHHYVSLCAGGASDLLGKRPSELETINDLDKSVVNFWRVMRDQPAALIEAVDLTPWSREEFRFCIEEPESPDSVEMARRFFVRSWMSMHGGTDPKPVDWRRRVEGSPPALDIRNHDLARIAKRLSLVQIENRPSQELVPGYDSPNTLFYFDPPYIQSTRTRTEGYAQETTDSWQEEMAALLNACQGYVVISGYASPQYTEWYEAKGWVRHDKAVEANSGAERVESVWLSPRTAQAFTESKRQIPMFG